LLQRNYDISNVQPINNNSNWLQPTETSIKMENQTSNNNAIKYIKIGREQLPSLTSEIIDITQPEKKVSWNTDIQPTNNLPNNNLPSNNLPSNNSQNNIFSKLKIKHEPNNNDNDGNNGNSHFHNHVEETLQQEFQSFRENMQSFQENMTNLQKKFDIAMQKIDMILDRQLQLEETN
jgi:hypothetical protein